MPSWSCLCYYFPQFGIKQIAGEKFSELHIERVIELPNHIPSEGLYRITLLIVQLSFCKEAFSKEKSHVEQGDSTCFFPQTLMLFL